MVYRNFGDIKLSALGLGCMRLPTLDGDNSMIDKESVKEMVAYAMEKGINYYDTAYGYHSGNSERVIGEVLNDYPRESYYLASKFPGYSSETWGRVEEIFEEQLQKTQKDYFDFYLFHNVCEMNIDAYLDPKYHIFDYLMEQKRNGRIRHLGFSAHASLDTLKRFLEAYGEYMEFGQLQINYMDWHFQEADKKYSLFEKYNIPVWVMEPLRGGKLCKLTDLDRRTLASFRPEENAVSWAFKWLECLPKITVTLSGMSNMDQLKENIEIYSSISRLSRKEFDTLVAIADSKTRKGSLPCTSCRYCTEYCPQGLNIPELLGLYNEHVFTGGGFIAPMAMQAIEEGKRPSACIGCRSCEEVCPQKIKISEAMADFAARLKD